jgi:hypothetical protein
MVDESRPVTRGALLRLLKSIAEITREHVGKTVDARYSPLEARVAALDARPRGLSYCGVWQRAADYESHDGVTHHGSIWVAITDHLRGVEPGTDSTVWQLSVKKGSDGKDLRLLRGFGSPTTPTKRNNFLIG